MINLFNITGLCVCHPLLTFWKKREPFISLTEWNKSKLITSHHTSNDDISFWLQLSARPQFIWHLNRFCDIYKGNQYALWFQSSFSLPKVDKQVMKSGQQALQNYSCNESQSNTYTPLPHKMNELVLFFFRYTGLGVIIGFHFLLLRESTINCLCILVHCLTWEITS